MTNPDSTNNSNNSESFTNSELEQFFSTHGVGTLATEAELFEFRAMVDKSKPTPREARFCIHMISGKSQTEAYMLAFGDNPDRKTPLSREYASKAASELIKRDRVKQYYWKLMQERDAVAEEQLPRLIGELNEAKELAHSLGQPAAMVTAIKTKANLLGLENHAPASMTVNLGITEDQRAAILERIAARAKQPSLHKPLPDTTQPVLDAEYTDVTPGSDDA